MQPIFRAHQIHGCRDATAMASRIVIVWFAAAADQCPAEQRRNGSALPFGPVCSAAWAYKNTWYAVA